jgi:hypothetical protein
VLARCDPPIVAGARNLCSQCGRLTVRRTLAAGT